MILGEGFGEAAADGVEAVTDQSVEGVKRFRGQFGEGFRVVEPGDSRVRVPSFVEKDVADFVEAGPRRQDGG